jgi:phosphomannomutase
MTIHLSFGTAGIRAKLGPAADQINPYTVGGVAHALCSQLAATSPGAAGRGLCVAFDGRTDSALLAREVVRVARLHGFRVRAFEQPTPTPLLAFATRLHAAAAGVVVTASHNPPEDNGLKIYLEGGGQIRAPHDRQIAARIAAFDAGELAALAPDVLGSYEALGPREQEAYLDAVTRLVAPCSAALPRLAYSALCGVGSAITRRLWVRTGVRDVVEVLPQAEPRADFGGLKSPNPEHESALAALFALSEAERAQLALAHDPDADRLAVIMRDRRGALRLLSGDEVGALLGSFMLGESSEPERALLVSTLVSGELLERIALSAGARFERTPTGFKYITARARELERTEGLRFVFGYEEAIGYAFGALGDDKDGIAALHVLLELARRLHAEGRTLCDRLDELAREHGVFGTRQLTLPRGIGQAAVETHGAFRAAPDDTDLVARLRGADPAALFGAGTTRIDYAQQPEAIELLAFLVPGALRVCVRPSGTEPKLKVYLHASEVVIDGDVEAAEQRVGRALDGLEQRVRAL